MLNQANVNASVSRNRIDQAIARARRERDAEVARLLGLAAASVRAAFTRAMTRIAAAMHASAAGGNTRHA